MTNLRKRIVTSLIVLPISIYFIVMGGNYIVSFLYAVLILGNFEVFSVFKRKLSIIFLDIVLVISLLSILFLRNDTFASFFLLIWLIILTICSDIGGYVFGKVFKWKKLTKISPKKTLSGAIGSFIFSLLSVFLVGFIFQIMSGLDATFLIKTKYFVLALIFSMVAQIGDLTISFFKRLAKIKNTGKIIPGHGGLLDRLDGIIFAIPVTYLVFTYIK